MGRGWWGSRQWLGVVGVQGMGRGGGVQEWLGCWGSRGWVGVVWFQGWVGVVGVQEVGRGSGGLQGRVGGGGGVWGGWVSRG